MTLPTSRPVAVAVLVLLGAAGAGALAGPGLGPLAGAAPSPRPSFVVTERAVVPAARHWTRARLAAASRGPGVSGEDDDVARVRGGGGKGLDYCEGTLQPDPFGTKDEGIACAMTEGGYERAFVLVTASFRTAPLGRRL